LLIPDRGVGHLAPVLLQLLATGTDIFIGLTVESESGVREGTIQAFGLVEDGNVRLNALFFQQPVEVLGRPIGLVGGKDVRAEAEPVSGPSDHGSCRADLGLPDRPAGFHIHDDRVVGIDQVVVGVGARLAQRLQSCSNVDAFAKDIVTVDDNVSDVYSDAKNETVLLRKLGISIGHALLHGHCTRDGVDNA